MNVMISAAMAKVNQNKKRIRSEKQNYQNINNSSSRYNESKGSNRSQDIDQSSFHTTIEDMNSDRQFKLQEILKFKSASEKEKHMEIQRRTSLLYGHQDLHKLIAKSEDSIEAYRKASGQKNDDSNASIAEK